MTDAAAALAWWAVLQLLSLTALPLAFRLFRRLPDRGYSLSKAMGVLLTCYLFWLLNSLGFLHNSSGGILFSAGALTIFSLWAYRRQPNGDSADLPSWIRRNGRLVLTVELLFASCFALWAFVRAYNPEITATEKPMDLAFINAVGRSDYFPPLDPWLSGFAISYYYFGYLITATVARLAGVGGSVAFNLGLAWQFAGTLLGAFGLVFNLVAASRTDGTGRGQRDEQGDRESAHAAAGEESTGAGPRWAIGFGLLGSVLVGVMGNLEGFLDVLHVHAVLPAGFWRWLDILDINTPPPAAATWPPRAPWWWWRASRVIHDRGLDGESLGLQPIDEFPFFSFLLGDMHPHVLALPFVFVALGLALNWWLTRWEPDAGSDDRFWGWLRGFLQEADPVHLGAAAVCLGALGFLNTWDFPFYLFVTVGALALAQLRERGWLDSGFVVEAWLLGLASLAACATSLRDLLQGELRAVTAAAALLLCLLTAVAAYLARNRQRASGEWRLGLVGQMLLVGAGLLAAGAAAYLPFYLGFRSQAGGILPNVINPTRLPQFLVMFGPFLFILALWLADRLRREPVSFRVFAGVAVGLMAALWSAAAAFAAAAIVNPEVQGVLQQWAERVGGMEVAVHQTLRLRAINPWTALLLLCVIGSAAALLHSYLRTRGELPAGGRARGPAVSPFVLLLVFTAAMLTLIPEYVYLRDNFGARLNTVFKFYYQAWVMFAIASGYALYALLQRRGLIRWVGGAGAAVLIAAGLVYPLLATPTKAGEFSGEPTLDGMAYMARTQPDDYAAIRWLQDNVGGTPTILEAVGGQYSWGGRISAHTGLPTVLGWAGHELQWRGSTPEPGIREPEINKLYTSRSWPQTEALLVKYGVEYVIVGPLELSTYGRLAATKFDRALETVFETDGIKIYQWKGLTE